MKQTLSTLRGRRQVHVDHAETGPGVAGNDMLLFTIATLLTWVHTLDEIRIGEFIAVPFAVANLAALVAWPRLGILGKSATSIGAGLFWGLAVIPYHVLPLLEGVMTWQNVSGLSRLIGGAMMVLLGLALIGDRDRSDPTGPPSPLTGV